MRLGKFYVRKDIAFDPKKLQILSEFINASMLILEKIAAFEQNDKETFVMMIGVHPQFDEFVEGKDKVIPEYNIEFAPSVVNKTGLQCSLVRKT